MKYAPLSNGNVAILEVNNQDLNENDQFVNWPENCTEISQKAFEKCTQLKSITVTKTIKKIGFLSFAELPLLQSVIIPDSVTAISNYAFRNCPNLTSVTLPNSIDIIHTFTFENCNKLATIRIDSNNLNEYNRIKNALPETLKKKEVIFQSSKVAKTHQQALSILFYSEYTTPLSLCAKQINNNPIDLLPQDIHKHINKFLLTSTSLYQAMQKKLKTIKYPLIKTGEIDWDTYQIQCNKLITEKVNTLQATRISFFKKNNQTPNEIKEIFKENFNL